MNHLWFMINRNIDVKFRVDFRVQEVYNMLVVTWVLVLCQCVATYMPSALGLWHTYLSGKALVPMLQLLHKKQQNLDKIMVSM